MGEDRAITIDDVARLAGVSRATAGRVVGNYGSVSEKAKERVLEAVRQLDYQPNLIARGLRSQSTKTIAVVIGSIRNTYSTALVYAVEKEAPMTFSPDGAFPVVNIEKGHLNCEFEAEFEPSRRFQE